MKSPSPVSKCISRSAAQMVTVRPALVLLVVLIGSIVSAAQDGRTLYNHIKAFSLTGGRADVKDLVLRRDRVEMTFTGTFYFAAPLGGETSGAVFIGQGAFRAQVPPDDFEKAQVKRLLGVDEAIESDFKTAVLRFSDDTIDVIGRNRTQGSAPTDAQVFASEIDARILKETGANISSRLTLSILNNEAPGFFFANFDGGKRGRFTYVFDYQTRIPTDYFGINAGERGLIFKYDSGLYGNDVWMAFHSLADYARGTSPYSDQNYVVDINHYEMNIDLRQPKKRMGLQTKIRMQPTIRNLRAISFSIGENLGEYDDARLKKQMRVKSVRMETAQPDVIQEDWESGFTVFLPSGLRPDVPFELEIDLEGDFLRQPEPTDPSRGRVSESFSDCSYPRSNSAWYPRHGYLDRSTFNFVFTHPKKLKVASTGTRVSELPAASDKEMVDTKYVMNFPVALATFALGPWERHVDSIKWENGDKPTPLEFNSLSTDNRTIKEDFILAELNNSVRYFQALFGRYPYDTYGAVFHPYRFGQGFATMLTIPGYSAASKYNYVFFAHETAHQWWGNIVLWRSYRDQWLSEGFAEYSGVVYTNLRDGPKSSADLIDLMRRSLRDPPQTETGPGKGKLVDVGPLVLGHRLESKKTYGAYSTLVYNKGALVLRMIHFLMTNPANGDGKPFYDMMKDFVERYRNKIASTDDFRIVANEHFARTPVAAKYGLKNLDWFFQQWVYETALPSYSLDYQIKGQPDGTAIVTGTVTQDNAPERWFMPLPVVYKLGGGKVAYGTVAALGPKAPFTLRLPVTPVSMELDPQRWVLSANTSTK